MINFCGFSLSRAKTTVDTAVLSSNILNILQTVGFIENSLHSFLKEQHLCKALDKMSATISRSPCLRKRPNSAPLLGEWTCFKRRGELLVLLADVARINDKDLLKDYFSFSMNAFITLWSRVGYQLSLSEEDLIKNTSIAKDQMILLPFNDAAEFISQHLIKQTKLLLRVFNPILKGNSIPITDTITIEPQSDSDCSREPSDDDCIDACEKSPEVDGKGAKQRSSKRGERALNELDCASGSEESNKKRKIGNTDCCPHTDDIFLQSIVTFTKAFVGKKKCEKDRILKQLEEEQKSRKSAEEKLKELEDQFKQQLQEERELRKAKENEVKALQEELQMLNSKRQALEDKLQGIKQFLQVGPDGKAVC
ncbi:uncharacterized protein LOC144650179 isoform X2 [Oculina patagonica]